MPEAGKQLENRDEIRAKLVRCLKDKCPTLFHRRNFASNAERIGALNAHAELIINVREHSVDAFNLTQDLSALENVRRGLLQARNGLASLSVASKRKLDKRVSLIADEEPHLVCDMEFGPIWAYDEPDALSLSRYGLRVDAISSMVAGIDALLKEKTPAALKYQDFDAAAVAYACLVIWREEKHGKPPPKSVNPFNNEKNPLNAFIKDVLRILKTQTENAQGALASLERLGGMERFSLYIELG